MNWYEDKEKIKIVQKEAFETACKRGFYICEDCYGEGEAMNMKCYGGSPVEVYSKCETCDGEGYILPGYEAIVKWLKSELLEMLEALIKNRPGDIKAYINHLSFAVSVEEICKLAFEKYLKDSWISECMDVIIVTLSASHCYGFELKYNKDNFCSLNSSVPYVESMIESLENDKDIESMLNFIFSLAVNFYNKFVNQLEKSIIGFEGILSLGMQYNKYR